MALWNHFNTIDKPRTNNNVEGYNRKLGNHCGAAHPNIYKAVDIFQKEEVQSYEKYKSAERGCKAPYRRLLDIDRERTLLRLVKQLKVVQSMLTLDNFVTCVLEEYTFECFQAKKMKTVNSSSTSCANPVEEEEELEEEDDLDYDGENNNENDDSD